MAIGAAAAVPAGGRPYRRARPRCGPPRLHRLRLPAAAAAVASPSPPAPSTSAPPPEGGGRLVAELVGAFDELTERMREDLATSSSSSLLFRALKLALPALRAGDGGRALARALVVAASLADLQMDAEVISAGIQREALDAGAISMRDIKSQIRVSIAHLLHESLWLKHAPSKVDVLDDESASALRKFCLSYYDIRAVILELVLKLDMAKRLKTIMLAAAELAALRLRDLPASDKKRGDCKNQAFCLLDKNGDGRISIEELTEVMEDLGARGEDATELMHLLDANSDGSLSSDEFESFQRQVELMRSLEDNDDHYRKILKEKLQTIDSAGLIHVYRKELGDKLLVS